jgi:hypothetical protein
MPGASCTRSLACSVENTRVSHRRHADIIRHSLRNGFTAYTCSPRCTGLFSHRRLPIIIGKLDPSVGRSGPHDFAVRTGRARLALPSRPSHPAPNVRDDWPKRPLCPTNLTE